jgi:hypothetical protein
MNGRISILTHPSIGSIRFCWLGDVDALPVEVTFIPKKWMPFWIINDMRLTANQSVAVVRTHAREIWLHLVNQGWIEKEAKV